ncbi:MAG: hypothetical protein AAFY78_10465 [Cyanobacteria bacterium J06648_16]
MILSSLPPEDQPPESIGPLDISLQRQLEYSTNQRFFEACGGPLQALLMTCRWYISAVSGLNLVIHCPDAQKNWRVLNQITVLADCLAGFHPRARIRVHPPEGSGDPFVMRVEERLEYRDLA